MLASVASLERAPLVPGCLVALGREGEGGGESDGEADMMGTDSRGVRRASAV
jgi:hypothetical protein